MRAIYAMDMNTTMKRWGEWVHCGADPILTGKWLEREINA
jgi:hypothetical protein